MQRAFAVAQNGKPGPVFVEIPVDVAAAEAEIPGYRRPLVGLRSAGDPAAVERASQLLAAAERPVIWAGGGVGLSGAEDALVALAETLDAPVVTTPSGRGSISEAHRLAFGSVGLYRTRSSARPVDEADCALYVGTRLEEFQTGLGRYLPATARVIQVDVDPFEIERNIAADVAVVGDAKLVLEQLADATPPVHERPWTVELTAFRAEYERAVESECSPGSTGPLRTKQVVHALNRVFADGFVLVHENGGQDLWSYYCPFVKVTAHRGCVAPAEQTVMGLGVAGAIGAKLARPDADVVCVTGDGAFQMYMKEIPTALQHSAPVLWVVLDNASLHWVKWIARATGERYLAVDFDVQPDLAAVAAASGAHAERIGVAGGARRRTRARPGRAARWAPGGARVRDRHLGLPRRIRRVPPRRVGSRATGRRERDMSWIETGSTHLLQAVHARGGAARACPRRGSRTSRSVPSRDSSSTSIPTGSGLRRSTRRGGCSTGSGCDACR